MERTHWYDEPMTGAIPGFAWSRCGEVTDNAHATVDASRITCPKCMRRWRASHAAKLRAAKRKAAKP